MARTATMSERDKQLYWDLLRGRGLVTMERVAVISSTCTDEADSLAFVEAIRGHVVALRAQRFGVPSAAAALRAEAVADGSDDAPVLEYMLNKTPANRARAVAALRSQELASRHLADVIHADAGAFSMRLM